MEHLKYPIGKFNYNPSEVNIQLWIDTIRSFPSKITALVEEMNDEQLATAYRPQGWTATQVVHHVADSHSHALLRFKTALTEEHPTIKPYLEGEYAKLVDYALPLESALSILKGVHIKWAYLLENMQEADYQKGYFHPESGKFFTLQHALGLYAWHCRHHYAHLEICAGKKCQ